MVRRITVMVLAASLALAASQTFQYSRGWTNGRKRSDPAAVVALGGEGREGVDLLQEPRRSLPQQLQQQANSHRSLPRVVEERLRAVEAGVGALLRAAQNPVAAEPDYYAQN
ncbi:pro-corazonin-like [Eriocheir sinensis]|uniref:pro-corazonin-like n=1 Tax=Eriocheir sinensis TaxID=95602 RepID=UPI0021C8EA34|nr:pro-corazonin-like [Eriocheir sinensis]